METSTSSSAGRQSHQSRHRIRLNPTQPQKEFLESPAKFKAFVGGVGSGKTYAGVVEAWRQPAGSTGMVLAPTYPMLRDASLRTFLELSRQAGILAEFLKGEMRATLANGTTVLFRTADDPERLRGPNLGWFWLDEAALMPQDVWLIMLGRLREHPGRAWITTTPKGKNWLYRTFVGRGGSYRVVKADSRTNVYLSPEFVAELLGNYDQHFAAQEVAGEWLDESVSQLIPDDWIDRCWCDRRPDPGPLRYLSADISKGSGRDRTVVMVCDRFGLLDLIVSSTVSIAEAARLVAATAAKWGVPHDQIVYDAGGWAGPEMGHYLEALGVVDAMPYLGNHPGAARFKNRRARSAWKVRQRIDPARPLIGLDSPPVEGYSLAQRRRIEAQRQIGPTPHFAVPAAVIGSHWDSLKRELSELRYEYDGYKIALEKKVDLVARLGHSPDLADTLIMNASLWSD